MGTYLRVLRKSYPMSTITWQGFSVFHKSLHSCALDENSLNIGRVNKGIHLFSSAASPERDEETVYN